MIMNMRLTTVLGCVNGNKNYYMFIPKQLIFWKKYGIKFIAVFVGDSLPEELIEYKENIILWNHNSNLHSAYVAQNLRIYYPALLDLPDDELLMITDMDMLPMNYTYYKNDLENFNKDDFIYYRHIDRECNPHQIYMCYNAANPQTWSKAFKINSTDDVINKIQENSNNNYDGVPGSTGWFIDQEIMYKNLSTYEHLKVLERPIKRLETWMYRDHLAKGHTNFTKEYDDAHFHRHYFNNEDIILDAENQLNSQ